MRRNRRGGGSRHEFGGSGEDSFVAVVVTKLTGALLFILLLTMVIMALLPKAVDVAPPGAGEGREPSPPAAPLAITTPPALPEAIAGRPYTVALAAAGGRGPLRWSLDGALPEGLTFQPESGVVQGTPQKGTPAPLSLAIRVTDGHEIASASARLLVYQSDQPLMTPAWWKPGIPPVPWKAWLDQGVGFLILWLVHLVSMGAVSALEQSSQVGLVRARGGEGAVVLVRRRFGAYRWIIRSSTLLAMLALAAWLCTAR
jgi:hypothetical protein